MLPQSTYIVSVLKKIWLNLLVATLSGSAIFYFLYYSETGYLPQISENYLLLIFSIVTVNMTGLVLYQFNQLLNRVLSWQKHLSARLAAGLVGSLVLTLIIVWLAVIIWLLLTGTNGSIWEQNPDLASKIIVITIISILIYSVFNFALFSYNQYTFAHIESEKTNRKYLELQFDLLKSQLSPHYLFNCLNTISSLVFKDTDLAEDFIRRLAGTYHYILQNNKKKYVTLKDEVEFVKSYNYLLQVRFENHLQLEINLPPNIMDSRIPPITLQMLVENAVKHNVISKENPMSIYISATDNINIKVANTKSSSPKNVNSFNVGLTNIQSRYSYLTNDKVKIEDGDKYIVTLPVVKYKIALSA